MNTSRGLKRWAELNVLSFQNGKGFLGSLGDARQDGAIANLAADFPRIFNKLLNGVPDFVLALSSRRNSGYRSAGQ